MFIIPEILPVSMIPIRIETCILLARMLLWHLNYLLELLIITLLFQKVFVKVYIPGGHVS